MAVDRFWAPCENRLEWDDEEIDKHAEKVTSSRFDVFGWSKDAGEIRSEGGDEDKPDKQVDKSEFSKFFCGSRFWEAIVIRSDWDAER